MVATWDGVAGGEDPAGADGEAGGEDPAGADGEGAGAVLAGADGVFCGAVPAGAEFEGLPVGYGGAAGELVGLCVVGGNDGPAVVSTCEGVD